MVLGAVMAVIVTTIFAVAANDHTTSYGTFVVLMILIAVSLATAFAPWMASFTETIERRNPALIAHGLSIWGLIIRVVIAVSIFFVPHVVNTVTPLVEKGPTVKAVLADPTPVGQTTIGDVAMAAAGNPGVVAQLTAISARDKAVIGALQSHPAIAKALATAQATGATPSPAQLVLVKAALGPQVFARLLAPQTQKDLAYLSTTAPKALGAANFAALSAPTPGLGKALATLATVGPGVQKAAAQSPKQWQKYFFIAVAGEVVFIPLILLMAGFWDPRKAKRAEEEHEALIATELAALSAAPTRAAEDDWSDRARWCGPPKAVGRLGAWTRCLAGARLLGCRHHDNNTLTGRDRSNNGLPGLSDDSGGIRRQTGDPLDGRQRRLDLGRVRRSRP
jgi:hypothetical protein